MVDAEKLRADFPLLVANPDLAYLDNAATAQKPVSVLEAMDRFYRTDYANPHRGVHKLGEAATSQYEEARATVAEFIGAPDSREVVFTRGTTEAINLVRYAWGAANLREGDVVVTTEMEHHANYVPWRMLTKDRGVELRTIRINEAGELDADDAVEKLRGAKLLTVTHVSNVLGTVNDIPALTKLAYEAGAKVLVDAAQSVPHRPIDVQQLGADFVAFSGHKMLGPTGIGVLWAKPELLESMQPFLGGGQMIRQVTESAIEYAEPPWRFEAGTMPVTEAIGLAAAIEYLQQTGLETIERYEAELVAQAVDGLRKLPAVTVYGPAERAGLVAFTVDGVHPHDLATLLDEDGVAIRSGHHCAQPLHDRLGVPATARASFGLYNTPQDVERLVAGVRSAVAVFQRN